MPATAGRVRMPHDNRVTTSSSLQTSSVWKNVIKYDPYAAADAEKAPPTDAATAKLIEQSKGLMELARLQAGHTSARTTCRRCGGVGHLQHECRNAARAGASGPVYEEIPDHAVSYGPGGGAAPSFVGVVPSAAAAGVAAPAPMVRERAERRSRSRSRSPSGDESEGGSGGRRHRHHSHRHRHRSHRHRDDEDRHRSRHRSRSRSRSPGHERGRDGGESGEGAGGRAPREERERRRSRSRERAPREERRRSRSREQDRRGGEEGRERARPR